VNRTFLAAALLAVFVSAPVSAQPVHPSPLAIGPVTTPLPMTAPQKTQLANANQTLVAAELAYNAALASGGTAPELRAALDRVNTAKEAANSVLLSIQTAQQKDAADLANSRKAVDAAEQAALKKLDALIGQALQQTKMKTRSPSIIKNAAESLSETKEVFAQQIADLAAKDRALLKGVAADQETIKALTADLQKLLLVQQQSLPGRSRGNTF
jgi:hypothetical protein